MKFNNYVTCSRYTASDLHDMATVVTQLKQDGHYEITEPEAFIANDIFERVKELKKDITLEDVQNAMNATGEKYYEQFQEASYLEIFSKRDKEFGYELHYNEFDYTYIVTYDISTIVENNVAYLVSEHIVNAGKGKDLLERMYHDVFDNLSDAEKYLEEMMEGYKHEGRTYRKDSGFKLCVVDKYEIRHKEWYKQNMLALRLLAETKEKPEEYRFYTGDYAVSELQKKKYETATREEKYEIDLTVYRRVYEYLKGWQTEILDTQMEKAKKDDSISSRSIADKAIVFAFINADSQIAYDIIHQKLDEYVCRIAQITEKHAHRYCMVCISKNAEIGYYDDAYEINTCSDADNPYFGKFSMNIGNWAIDHFQKYKEGIFVDELPSAELVDSYNQRERKEKSSPFS